MSLRDLMTADMSLFMNTSDFASTVTYRAANGLETTMDAVVFEAETQQDDNNGILTYTRTRSISFAATYTQVEATGVFVIDGKDWEVTPESITDGIMTTYVLKRMEIAEQGRPNGRRR